MQFNVRLCKFILLKKHTDLIDTKFLCKVGTYISHKYLKYLIFGLVTADSMEL